MAKYSWEKQSAFTLFSQNSAPDQLQVIVPRTQRRRGLQRFLTLIIDGSKAMSSRDMSPTRIELVLGCVREFISDFFEQNPLSQLQLVSMRDGLAKIASPLSGNSALHQKGLQDCLSVSGEVSLKNALSVAVSSLRTVPKYGTREVLIIMGSLTSCDPESLIPTVKQMKSLNIICSIIGLAAEVYLCKRICSKTQGEYRVSKHEAHFRELLMNHIPPPKVFQEKEKSETVVATFVQMGFPVKYLGRSPDNKDLCDLSCPCPRHNTANAPEAAVSFCICPRCSSKQCTLPSSCSVCGLTLVSAYDLAQSYHHLFPVPYFNPCVLEDEGAQQNEEDLILALMDDSTPVAKVPSSTTCYACSETPVASSCPDCCKYFCSDCDSFIHNLLHNCPGCL